MANGYSTMGVPGAVGMTRPSMGMTGGTMPNPSTMGMTGGTMPRPLAPFLSNLSLSNSPTIAVNESTPNLDRIQNFPVVSRNGVFHIHQDPATGQRYSMTDEFHARIPEILSRTQTNTNTDVNRQNSRSVINYQIVPVDEETENISQILSFQPYLIRETFTLYNEPGTPILYRVSKNLAEKYKSIVSSRGTGIQNIEEQRIDNGSILYPISNSEIFNETVIRLNQERTDLFSTDPTINFGTSFTRNTGGAMPRGISQVGSSNIQQPGIRIIQQTVNPVNTYVNTSTSVTNTSVTTVGISNGRSSGMPINTYYQS